MTQFNKNNKPITIEFGNLTLDTIDEFINVSQLLNIFNNSIFCINKERKLYYMIRHMNRPKFSNQIIVDYDQLSLTNKLMLPNLSKEDKMKYMIHEFLTIDGKARFKQVYVHKHVAI